MSKLSSMSKSSLEKELEKSKQDVAGAVDEIITVRKALEQARTELTQTRDELKKAQGRIEKLETPTRGQTDGKNCVCGGRLTWVEGSFVAHERTFCVCSKCGIHGQPIPWT
jgi:hypothetical protein